LNIKLSPIALFCYNRIDTLIPTITYLQNNYLAKNSNLYVFSDGPKNLIDFDKISEIRRYLSNIKGFSKVIIIESETNQGLTSSIINGINYILKFHDSVIILEDDLITSNNFLNFMNDALNYYKFNNEIFTICGYSPIIKNYDNYDFYFTKRSSSWGWAIWSDRWAKVNFKINLNNIDHINKSEYNKMGSDMYKQLVDLKNNKIHSWCILFIYNQYLLNKFSVFPTVSKVVNIGISHKNATNTKFNLFRFKTILDISNKITFNFSNNIIINQSILIQFLNDYSFKNRILNKLYKYLFN
jgi:hypothetical protein